jgi:ATP/maltotriose-dependent transcriptional regulator MalT
VEADAATNAASLAAGRGFVGRAEELAALSASVERARAGQSQVVWIEGEAGSGKTGLLGALVDRLPADVRLLRAEADELAADASLDLVGQLAPLTASDGFGAGLELLDLFDRAQDDGPLAVVIEDLHWADLASRQAALTAARRLREDRVVIVITTRPVPRSDGWDRFVSDPDRCTRLRLGPLTIDDVRELAQRAGVPLDRPGAARLREHTGGLVLYVRTLLSELSPAQLLSAEAGLSAPHSLASTTTAGIAELPRGARELASAIAVLNQRLPLQVVAAIADVAEPESALEALLSTGFVTWWPSEVGTPVEYSHPLYRAAVYDDLSPTHRRDLHLAAAAVLDGEASLSHRVAASGPGDDALLDELMATAQAAAEQGELGTAARNWLWAAALSADSAGSDGALLEATRLLLADGQLSRALSLRDRILDTRAGPMRSLALGILAWEDGDAITSERWLRESLDTPSDDADPSRTRIAALVQLAGLLVTQGRGPEAVDTATAALDLHPNQQRMEMLAWSELARAEGLVRGAASALGLLEGRLRADAAQVAPLDADLLVTRGILGFYAGRTSQGIADLRNAVQLARRGARVDDLPRAHLQLAQLLIVRGEWDDAVVHARVGVSLVDDGRRVWLESQAHAALGSVSASRGAWDSAATHVDQARRAADLVGTNEAIFTARIVESAVARARADAAGIIEALGPLVGSGESSTMSMVSSLGWWPVLIHALIDVGDLDRADRQLAQLSAAAADRNLNLHARQVGLGARLLLARGDATRASDAFVESIAGLTRDDPLLDRALLHHDFGQLLQARGKRQEAVEQLGLAHSLFAAVRADPYQRRVDSSLEACGLRSRSASNRSPLALTDREEDVAALVTKGWTNKQVAAELYVSSKAVEYHLRNVYGKLGITSRSELSAALSA